MITRRHILEVAISLALLAGTLSAWTETSFGATAPDGNSSNRTNKTIYLPQISFGAPEASIQTRSIYWGAYVDGGNYGTNPATHQAYGTPPWDLATLDRFEADAGKKVSIVHWGQPWYASDDWPHGYTPFEPNLMNAVRGHGAIPMIDWASWDLSAGGSVNQPKFSLASIITGQHDAYIRQFATDAKAWGFPFFIRFNWEMNGSWFPWSENVNGNRAGEFVAAWRHVHDIFTAVGANNVTWVWCPNTDEDTFISLAELYPGDAYVDWTGFDVYNKDPKVWETFATALTGRGTSWIHNSYQELMTLAPGKPIMLGESASLEAGDGGAKKAGWITDALTNQIPYNFPAIKAMVWFNWNCDPGSSYTIESSAPARAAFAAGIGAATYTVNQFGNLPSGAKVGPLS